MARLRLAPEGRLPPERSSPLWIRLAPLRYLAGFQSEELVAGPSILHRSTPEAFRRKYLAVAAMHWEGPQPFEPSPAEEAAVALLRSLAGADPAVLDRELAALYQRLTSFTPAELAADTKRRG